MKTIIITILICLAITSIAQDSVRIVDETIFIGDIEIVTPVYETTNGERFIEQSSGVVWIGKPYKDGFTYVMHEGYMHQVRISKGKLLILVRKDRNIYCKYICYEIL